MADDIWRPDFDDLPTIGKSQAPKRTGWWYADLTFIACAGIAVACLVLAYTVLR